MAAVKPLSYTGIRDRTGPVGRALVTGIERYAVRISAYVELAAAHSKTSVPLKARRAHRPQPQLHMEDTSTWQGFNSSNTISDR